MSTVNKMSLDDAKVNDLIIGIDLGTTNSAVAVHTDGLVPKLCPMGPNGKITMQSCVRWDGGDNFTVGPEAYAERYKSNVCYSVKRLMGSDQKVVLTLPGTKISRIFTPVQISAEILKALKKTANEFYPGVYRCVITVPAYFNQRQIEDTIEASKLAGLDCVQILKEPTSASYIYSNLGYAKDGSILIYDLGGGTFDITVMSFLQRSSIPTKMINTLKKLYNIDVNKMGDDDSSLYFCRVLGTYGDTRLGGDDIDTETAKIVLKNSGHPKPSKEHWEELILRCEQFKKGNAEAIEVNVGGKKYLITRNDLQQATRRIFNKTVDILNQIPKEQLEKVKTIVLVGGSTKSNDLVDMLQEVFPDKEISRVLDPDATVALGAGAVAKDLQTGKGLAYQDVLPLGIGILTDERQVSFCVSKNTSLPHIVNQTFYTMYDNQQAISLHVYQGLSTNPKECVYLGTLRVDNLPPKPAGELKIGVSFLLSAQGRLTVTTTVEGISEKRELVIDSIFNVNKDDTSSDADEFNYDEFEKSLASIAVENEQLKELLYKRRTLLNEGKEEEALELENEILEVL